MRNAIFATVAQRAIRAMANNIFLHLHNMDLSFHLTRQTGALARALDRGNKGISFFLSSIIFNIVPTIFEVGLVAGLLGHRYGSLYAGITVSTVAAYTAFTFGITAWRYGRDGDNNRTPSDGLRLAESFSLERRYGQHQIPARDERLGQCGGQQGA